MMAYWSLDSQDISIWYARLDQFTGDLAALAQSLSIDEQARADGFRFSRDRERFVTCRAILRMLLARYLATTPSRLTFTYQSHGKPALAADWRDSGVDFNLAHSNGVAMYAFTRIGPLGVDLEYVRPLTDVHRLAAEVFSSRERAAFCMVPAHLQQAAFFHGWTRKEAFLKATGAGLSVPLRQIDVTLEPGKPAALLSIGGSAAAASGWLLRGFEPVQGYVAAVAVAATACRLVCREWRGDAIG